MSFVPTKLTLTTLGVLKSGVLWFQKATSPDDVDYDGLVYTGITQSLTYREDAQELLRRGSLILEYWHALNEGSVRKDVARAYFLDHAFATDLSRLHCLRMHCYVVRYFAQGLRRGNPHTTWRKTLNRLRERLCESMAELGIDPERTALTTFRYVS